MLIDTDVLIWMTRGHAGAAARLQTLLPWRISAVTYIELAQGCRNKQELAQIKKGLALSQTQFWINGNESCIVVIDLLCNTLVSWFKFPRC
ncbi:putative nucleic acid-binding protein [Oxalobacteraceae bacterium GrIS 2.11]